jgi:hypothetical protein
MLLAPNFPLVLGMIWGKGGRAYGVSEKRRTPTGKNTSDAFGAVDESPCFHVALVEGWIDLASTFDQIQWRDGGMRQALYQVISPIDPNPKLLLGYFYSL